jgi:Tfp pilus assembly protein PilV
MPSKSPAQHRFMSAVAHSPSFAKKAGVSQKVGKEFADADRAGSSPKTKDDHMSRRAQHMPQRAVAKEFGTSQSTVSRRTMKRGFSKVGG